MQQHNTDSYCSLSKTIKQILKVVFELDGISNARETLCKSVKMCKQICKEIDTEKNHHGSCILVFVHHWLFCAMLPNNTQSYGDQCNPSC